MDEKKKRLNPGTVGRIIRTADGIFSVASLVFSLNILTFTGAETSIHLFALLSYLFLAASKSLQAAGVYKKCAPAFYGNICSAAILTAAGIFVFLDKLNETGIKVYVVSFCLMLAVCRVAAMLKTRAAEKKKLRRIRSAVMNGIFILAVLLYALAAAFSSGEQMASLLLTHLLVAFITVLLHIIAISFSQMKLGVLQKILRKTFAAEIFFGLMLLIIAFSFVFRALEPGIPTYLDALWYCFSVVTTVGFGDLTVVGGVSRAITVILGAYGIIVVALITSVVVNFYNEVKDSDDDGEAEKHAPRAGETESPAPGPEEEPRE